MYVQGVSYLYGVGAFATTDESRLDGVRVKVTASPTSAQGIGFSGNGASPVITNSRFDVTSGASQFGIYIGSGGGTLALRDSEVHTTGPGAAVHIDRISATLLGDIISSAELGVEIASGSGFSLDINSCNITGGTYWLNNQAPGFTVTVGASKLVGPTTSIGTTNCFGNYTGSAFLANTCP